MCRVTALQRPRVTADDEQGAAAGAAVSRFVKGFKSIEKMIVVYDDLDLPFGSLKISYERGSGGHKGLDSIMSALKTKSFTRIRIGISPTSASGEIKKPEGERNVEKFILGEFAHSELTLLKKTLARAGEAIEAIISEGREKAMNLFN